MPIFPGFLDPDYPAAVIGLQQSRGEAGFAARRPLGPYTGLSCLQIPPRYQPSYSYTGHYGRRNPNVPGRLFIPEPQSPLFSYGIRQSPMRRGHPNPYLIEQDDLARLQRARSRPASGMGDPWMRAQDHENRTARRRRPRRD